MANEAAFAPEDDPPHIQNDDAFRAAAMATDRRLVPFAATVENFLINPIEFFRFYPHKVWNIPEAIREVYNVLVYEIALEGWVAKHKRHGFSQPHLLEQRQCVQPGTSPTYLTGKEALDGGLFLKTNELWNDPGQLNTPFLKRLDSGDCDPYWDAVGAVAKRFPKARKLETRLANENFLGDRCANNSVLRSTGATVLKSTGAVLSDFRRQLGEHPTHAIAMLRECQNMYACATARSGNAYGGGTVDLEQLSEQPSEPYAATPPDQSALERTYVRVGLRPLMRRNFLTGPLRYTIDQELMHRYAIPVDDDGNELRLSRQGHLRQLVQAFRQVRGGTLGQSLGSPYFSQPRREARPSAMDDWDAFVAAGTPGSGDPARTLNVHIFFGYFDNVTIAVADGETQTQQQIAELWYTRLAQYAIAMIQSMNATNMPNDRFKAHLGLGDNLPRELSNAEKAFKGAMHRVTNDCQTGSEWTRLAFMDAKLRYLALRIRERRAFDVSEAGLVFRPQSFDELNTDDGLDFTKPTNRIWRNFYQLFEIEDWEPPANISMWPPNFGDKVTTRKNANGVVELLQWAVDPTNCMQKHFVIPKPYGLAPEEIIRATQPKDNPRWTTKKDAADVPAHYNNTGVYPLLFDYIFYKRSFGTAADTRTHSWVANATDYVTTNLGLPQLDAMDEYLPVPTYASIEPDQHNDNDARDPLLLPGARSSKQALVKLYRSYWDRLRAHRTRPQVPE